MVRQSKADIRAERDALAKQAEQMARDLRALSENIEAAIIALPLWTKPSAVALLKQQADRAHSFAVALAVESRGPDPETTRLLLQAWKPIGAALIYAIGAITTGALEHVGAEGVDQATPVEIQTLKTTAQSIVDPVALPPGWTVELHPAIDPNPWTDARAIRAARMNAGLTVAQVAQGLDMVAGTVSRWESGKAQPTTESMRRLEYFFGRVERETMTPTARLEFESAVEHIHWAANPH